ncbi:hypothetical protein MRX96_034094 [Rhipicephalus microplus]
MPRWLQEFFSKSDSTVALKSRRSLDVQGLVAPIIEEAEVPQTSRVESSRKAELKESALVERKETRHSTLLVERPTSKEMQLKPVEVAEESKEDLSGGLFTGTWESETEDSKKSADGKLEKQRPRHDILIIDADLKEYQKMPYLAKKPAEEAPNVEARVWSAESGLEESFSEEELIEHDIQKGKKKRSKKPTIRGMSLVVLPTPDGKAQSQRHSIDLRAKDSSEGLNASEVTVALPLTQQEYPAITYDAPEPPRISSRDTRRGTF